MAQSEVPPNLPTVDFTTHLERDIGVPEGFLSSLAELDDWSCVIKVHAVLEAALTHALVGVLGRVELHDILSRLELSGARTGKIEIAKVLGILGSEERRFIRALSELRNQLVHDIANVAFSFKAYIATLNAQQRKGFVEAFGLILFVWYRREGRIPSAEVLMALDVLVCTVPKVMITFGVTTIAAEAYIEKVKASTKHLLVQHFDEVMEVLRESSTSEGLSKGA